MGKSVPVSIEPTPKPDKTGSTALSDDRDISAYFVRTLIDEIEATWNNK